MITTIRKPAYIAVAVVAALTIGACSGGSDKPALFTSPENDYTVEFAGGDPKEQEQQAPMPDGGSLPVKFYISEHGGRGFMVSRAEYPQAPADVKASLEGAQNGAVEGTSGELIDSKEIELQGRQGREYSARVTSNGEKGMYISRNYLHDKVMYQVLVTGPGEFDANNKDVKAFFDSFRFTADA